jgi:Helicase associated domain
MQRREFADQKALREYADAHDLSYVWEGTNAFAKRWHLAEVSRPGEYKLVGVRSALHGSDAGSIQRVLEGLMMYRRWVILIRQTAMSRPGAPPRLVSGSPHHKKRPPGTIPGGCLSVCHAGYGLGRWVVQQRADKDKMASDRRQRLEALPGWSWSVYSDLWEEGFFHLREFSDQHGHCRVPKRFNSGNGYGLGNWVVKQRADKDKMASDRRQRLEALPGWAWKVEK